MRCGWGWAIGRWGDGDSYASLKLQRQAGPTLNAALPSPEEPPIQHLLYLWRPALISNPLSDYMEIYVNLRKSDISDHLGYTENWRLRHPLFNFSLWP